MFVEFSRFGDRGRGLRREEVLSKRGKYLLSQNSHPGWGDLVVRVTPGSLVCPSQTLCQGILRFVRIFLFEGRECPAVLDSFGRLSPQEPPSDGRRGVSLRSVRWCQKPLVLCRCV